MNANTAGKLRTGVEFMLRRFSNRNLFRIRAEQSEQLQEEFSVGRQELIHTLLDIYKEQALAEISGFQVAAAAVGYSGDIYMGVNLETPFANLGNTVHAEQFVMVNAHQSKEAGLSQFVVSDFPCGHCRQFLFELPNPERISVQVPSRGVDCGLNDLLPNAFSGKDLKEGCPTLLEKVPRNHFLRFDSHRRHKLFAQLEDTALAAVRVFMCEL